MILGYTIYQIISLFFIYAFLGWCVEVVYCGLGEGHFINRGFLNGPVCPIYGVGGTLVVLCLTPISHNVIALFIGSAILTSALELITGFALDKLFHARWWDYSDLPFNIGGYICLKYSVYWGLVCIALMKGIHPLVMDIIKIVPAVLGTVLLIIFGVTFIADVIITVVTIHNLNKRMKLMNDIAERIHSVSDKIGEGIYDGAVKAKDKGDEMMEKHEKELARLREKYADMAEKRSVLQNRIIKAFPKMQSHTHNEQLEKLKEKFKRK